MTQATPVTARALFATQLRSNRPPIELVKSGTAGAITVRVELAEQWDAVRVVARPDSSVADLKGRVTAAFYPDGTDASELVLKFRGWEVLDDHVPLSACGIVDGSILLLGYRRRRPVR